MELNLLETIARLVSTPSVNPLGKSASGPEFLESQLTDVLESIFYDIGLPHQRQKVHPGRENIVARLDGRVPPQDGGRVIVFDAHQDTVRVEGMTIDPFKPVIRDGRIFGRGTCDTKGAMAAMLVAASRLAKERPDDMPTIMLTFAVDEEHGFTGIQRLAELWSDDALAASDSIFPCRPHAAIVGEPTELQVVVAHKGAVRWQSHTSGLAAHSSMPELGQNAVYRMARLLPLFEQYQSQAAGMVTSHHLCGAATLNVGLIHGGMSVNTVPDRCTITIDRRVPPGEDPYDAREHVLDFIDKNSHFDFSVEHDAPSVVLLPLADDENGALADEFVGVAREVAGKCEKTGAVYGTHAANYAAAGIPSIVFGPGSAQQAHTVDEWLSVEQLEKSAEIFYQFARRAHSGRT
ncbi:MAG: M20 family metallopeptidase [Pirellulales bacterium]|nr:M20 family metallopeptidase [Pirellulales bacterium]